MSETSNSLPIPEQKKVKLKGDGKLPNSIKKGNRLIFAKQDLTPHEQNLFNIMIAHMEPKQWDNNNYPVFEFKAADLSDWLGIESRHLSATLTPVADRLAKKTIGVIYRESGEFKFLPLFKEISYKNAKLSMIPNDALSMEYVGYVKGFALINSKTFFKISHSYSKRIYEMLSRFKSEKFINRHFPIDDLKAMLGVTDEKGKIKPGKKSLEKPSVFVKRCIVEPLKILQEKCKDEILLLTDDDGNKGFIPIKKGRSIVSIKFNYRWINKEIQLDRISARATIKELENKRWVLEKRLENSELEFLASAYLKLDREDKATEIYDVLIERHEAANAKPVNEPEDDNLDTFFERIDRLKNGSDEGY